MTDTPPPGFDSSPLRAAFEQLLIEKEPEWKLIKAIESEGKQTYLLRQKSGRETISLHLNTLPSTKEATEQFALNGNQFIAPKLTSGNAPAEFDPPIKADATVPSLADENHLWNGYGTNTRGVIKLLKGGVIVQVNAPTAEDAERFARHIVNLLDAT